MATRSADAPFVPQRVKVAAIVKDSLLVRIFRYRAPVLRCSRFPVIQACLAAIFLLASATGEPLPAQEAQAAAGHSAGPSTRGRFFVPVSNGRLGFGPFRGRAKDAVLARRVFGPPSGIKHLYDGYGCRLFWRSIGVSALFARFGSETAPTCGAGGTFVEARLTDRRWHTAVRVRPGSRAGKARRHASSHCGGRGTFGRYYCPATGYVFGWHRTVCSTQLSPNVIAHVRGHWVVSLLDYWHGCE